MIQITKEESLQLLEEMQEDTNKMCPHCNGICLWRRGTYKPKTAEKEQVRYTCKECGKFFTLHRITPKIKGQVAEFIVSNLNVISPEDLSKLVHKYFKVSISRQTIYIFKKLLIKKNNQTCS